MTQAKRYTVEHTQQLPSPTGEQEHIFYSTVIAYFETVDRSRKQVYLVSAAEIPIIPGSDGNVRVHADEGNVVFGKLLEAAAMSGCVGEPCDLSEQSKQWIRNRSNHPVTISRKNVPQELTSLL